MAIESSDLAVARAICANAYEKTAAFYGDFAPHLGDRAFGYKLLYSPPIFDAPFLFMGFQPGGSLIDAIAGERAGERTGWPDESEYATANWKLAVKARKLWGAQALRASTGLNSVFFRSPNRKSWNEVPRHWRDRAEQFSRELSKTIVRTLSPKRIVIFGLDSVCDFEPDGHALFNERRRRLVQPGYLWGYPAHAVIHPSGARLSTADEDCIRRHFLD